MFRGGQRFVGCLASLAFVALGAVVAAPVARASIPSATGVIINEVYGGGGNSGALYANDFIELYNAGDSPVDLTGWSVQYRGPGVTTAFTGITPLTGTIAPGATYLIQEAAGAGGSVPLPPAQATGSIAMGGTGGQVLLATTTIAQTCDAGNVSCAALIAAEDFVGWGATTVSYLGAGPAGATTNTTSASRTATHDNSWSNSADYTVIGPPSPGTAVPIPPDDIGLVPISQVQGTGNVSPHVGDLATVRGVVTAAYPTGGFSGFVIQTDGSGGDADLAGRTASDGLFVFSTVAAAVTTASANLGQVVEVKGLVSEFNGLTEISLTSAADLTVVGAPTTAPAPITAPWPGTDADREKIESMLYAPPGAFTVTDTFSTNSFGEVGLASGTTPLVTPTDVARPNTAAYTAAVASNAARLVTLDDGASTNFLSAANQSQTPPYISLTDPLRVGAAATFNASVIVDFRNSLWKLQPLAQVTDTTLPASRTTFSNTRTAAPDAAALGSGELSVASFNVLNYFTTLGAGRTPACTSFNDRAGNPITVNSCPNNGPRGAWDAANLARQQAKIVAAINTLDADVVGLMEIESSATLGETADEATTTLVNALNTAAGFPKWAVVPSSTQLPPPAQRDVIANAIIYQPLHVTRLGNSVALGTESDAGEAFDNAREPIGQVFMDAGGGDPFFVVVNHFKSKGSGTGLDADMGDGQGASNFSRVRQANALRDWVPTVLATYATTSTPVDDVFLLGDFNSYTMEDPLEVLYGAGYTDLNLDAGNTKQSYNFDGQNGSLDHILGNAGALARVTGSDIWNINAPESIALEYSRYNYHGTLFYDATPYRSSDHDPVIAAFRPRDPSPAGTTDITLVSINDFHGRIDANTVKWAGTVEQIVASAGGADVAITGAGDLVSASLFASAVQDDQPTIDVMNAIGLDASAVGNHEFDKGWPDLRDRILGGDGDPDNNAAHWDYLGANVYDSTQLPALVPLLPEYSIITIDGIDVAVIGAVTEETPALVSPAGMVGVTIGDPVEAVNRVAEQLTDGNALNGEADVLVATFHEGAPTGETSGGTLASNLAASTVFTEIVQDVSPKVDVLFNGHTHQAYAWDAPNAGGTTTNGMRPVLQTGSYGDFVGKVVLHVDTTTKDVTSYSRVNVPRTVTADQTLIAAFPQLTQVKTIVDNAIAFAATIGNQPKGVVSNDITTAYTNGTFGPTGFQAVRNNTNRDQRNAESTLGGLVANALLETLEPLGVNLPTDVATIGVVNPGGLRAELFYPTSTPLNEGDGVVTYAEANAVLPFVNNLWTTHLTGAQFKTLLEQQWQRDNVGVIPTRAYLQLGLSDNVSYTFDPALPEGSRVTSITVDGQPIDPAATYKIATFSFLTAGGDNFRVFTQGTGAADSGLVDRDAWIAYLEDHATPPGLVPDYVRRSAAVSPAPTSLVPGGSVTTTLSYLDLTSLGTPENTSVDVSLGGVALGSAPITFTPAASGNAAPVNGLSGTAAVNLAVPADQPAGAQTLRFVVQPSGQVIELTVTVADSTPPAAPVITVPAAGSTVATATPAIGGTAEPGATVTISVDGAVIGTAVAGPTGEWSFTPTTPLADGPHSITATATDADGNESAASSPVPFIVDTSLPAPEEPVGTLDPQRILDTRPGGTTYDSQFAGIGIQSAGTTLQLTVGGRGGVPADAEGVVLNVTATDATGVGYVTVWPCGFARPEASSLNFDASSAAPNAVLTAIGDDGKVCLYTAEASAHLIADVNGFVPAGSGYEPLNPARLADSRDGAYTVDGAFLGGGPRTAGSTWAIDIAGRGGVPADAETASLNITVTGGAGTGYVTVWPCNEAQPTASSLNFQVDQNVPNAVISKLSPSGEICVFVAEAAAHVIVDVNGYFPVGSGYGALNPARLLDTRNAPTIDGQFTNLGPRQPGEVLELTVTGRGGVPATATGVVLNVTSTNATGTGYVTVWPCTGPAPNVSTVNYVAGVTRANASIAKLSPTGKVCLVVMEASTDLIVDVTGYLGS